MTKFEGKNVNQKVIKGKILGLKKQSNYYNSNYNQNSIDL